MTRLTGNNEEVMEIRVLHRQGLLGSSVWFPALHIQRGLAAAELPLVGWLECLALKSMH